VAVTSTIVDETPLKYVWASLHTPVEETVAVADTVFETEKLSEGDLVVVTDEDAALESDTDADSDLLFVLESDSDLEVVRDGEALLVSVTSTDTDADTLGLPVELTVVVASIDSDAVVEAVKLGETGDAVTDGVIDGVGKNTVYDTKKADPPDAILIISAKV
jgi:hypothetical protein